MPVHDDTHVAPEPTCVPPVIFALHCSRL